jgi:hypothetical protein
MKKIILLPALALLTGVLVFVSSCSRHECDGPVAARNDDKLESKVKDMLSRIPRFMLTKPADRSGPSSGFNFSNHNGGFNFNVSSSGVTFSDQGGTIFFASSAFGANAGGTVVAGSSSLDINYTFCFSASDSATGLNLFDVGGNLTDVAAVIGVSGDFEGLANADPDSTDFSDIFHGLAFYIVWDDELAGSHDVIDWEDTDLNDSTAVDGNALAFVFDFQQGKFYISSGGTVNVSGGTMNFNGEYLEVSGFVDDDGNFDLSGDLSFRRVSGFGAMGCN